MAKRDTQKIELLRNEILKKVREYYELAHKPEPYTEGDRINYSGRIFDEHELSNLVDSSLDFWLTTGKYCDRFEKDFAKFLGVKYCSLVNSGSSANLLAFMALTSDQLGVRKINRGDEIITVAAAFPTTVAPIIQYGAVPIFLDVTLPSYNIDVTKLERALSEKTKAVFAAHTLGNPFDLKSVKNFCEKNNLWLIEDNCDALGSKYLLHGNRVCTGAVGDIGTSSFYPPHHMTMGEGGAVYTNNRLLNKIVNSLRDWGRDCWCPSGKDNTCHKRFDRQFGQLPFGYDHKYVYSHFGYNLKATEMQAAIGCAQLEKLPFFIEKRKENWNYLRKELNELSDVFILPEPTLNSEPSWFGFLLTVRNNIGFSRNDIVDYLEKNNIQTRTLFAGNIIKHPCFDIMRESGKGYRVVEGLENTDLIMNNTFWIGVYPGMNEKHLDYMIKTIKDFVNLISSN